jgi:F-box interacting protein
LYYDNHAFDEYCKIGSQIDCMVNPDPINGRFRVAGICDGLVCLADDILSKAMKYIIWNPSIRKAVMLPRPGVTFTTHGPFEDSIGFGFDAMTNDYKVVRLVTLERLENEDGESPTVAEVYSLATGSWRSLGSVAPPCRILGTRRHAFFNGAILWAIHGAYYSFILAFDLGSESFREILMPKGTELHRCPQVSVSGDGKSLALFTRSNDKDDGTSFDIWVMKEYCMHESWTKLITLRPQGSLHPQVICFRKSGEVLLVLSERYSQRQTLVSLDLVSQQLYKLGNFEYEYFSIDSYEESLVLLDMDNAVSC